MNNKIKDFWQKYEYKIILIVGFVLVAIVSFEGGFLRGQKIEQNPLIIEKPAEIQALGNSSDQRPLEGQKMASEVKNSLNKSSATPQTCAFVGSKNSNKYHLPICRYAKNINPENQVCFSSENEAKSKGYLPDKNCIQ